MLARRLIERKRDGGRIDAGEWRAFAHAYETGHIPDSQAAALLMAIFLKGMDLAETAALTDALLECGARLDFSTLAVPRADKHSTGGIGDKVSLILAPLIASLGVAVPMMSGRSLGHTGGTLDKLESIPGFRTDLSLTEVRDQIERLGCALFGQSPEIAPVDRKLYALRDATATVESIPLICASIMSKKLAEGLTALVLDIKRGSGAFFPEFERAVELAQWMIKVGQERGLRVVALLTAMDRPLGRAVGNALEVEEAILTLKGEGPGDLLDVTYALGAEMLVLTGAQSTHSAARRAMEHAISSGKAAETFVRVIEAQGGEPGVVEDPSTLPQADACELYVAARRGIVSEVRPRPIGRGIEAMGGGRSRPGEPIDPTVGFVITARVGDWVEEGEPLATIFARNRAGIDAGRAALARGIIVGEEAELPLPLVSHRVTGEGVEVYASE